MNHTIGDDYLETVTTVLHVMYGFLFLQFTVLLYKSSCSKNWDLIEDDYSTDDECDTDNDNDTDTEVVKKITPIVLAKYEEKYMEKLKGLSTRILNEEELIQLNNNYVMEMTPSGNVIMFWNNKRGTFTFYADSTIPYRFLEVVARKYVIYNQCKQLYILLQPCIKDVSKCEGDNTAEVNPKNAVDIIPVVAEQGSKPGVFAKLKSYNQTSINSVKALQSNINTSVKNNSQSNFESAPKKGEQRGVRGNPTKNGQIDIKENANRYTCEGKIANFSFLKKEKKTGKKISFAEYKKLKLYTTSK